MFDKLKSVEERFEEISLDLTKPETVKDALTLFASTIDELSTLLEDIK